MLACWSIIRRGKLQNFNQNSQPAITKQPLQWLELPFLSVTGCVKIIFGNLTSNRVCVYINYVTCPCPCMVCVYACLAICMMCVCMHVIVSYIVCMSWLAILYTSWLSILYACHGQLQCTHVMVSYIVRMSWLAILYACHGQLYCTHFMVPSISQCRAS